MEFHHCWSDTDWPPHCRCLTSRLTGVTPPRIDATLPADNDTVVSPSSLTITFNENILEDAGVVQVFDDSSLTVRTTAPTCLDLIVVHMYTAHDYHTSGADTHHKSVQSRHRRSRRNPRRRPRLSRPGQLGGIHKLFPLALSRHRGQPHVELHHFGYLSYARACSGVELA